MKLSTRARYGTRAMVELALSYPERAVSVREMANNERLSIKYLEQIMSALKAAGLVRAARGLHGGYTLARPPASIKLSEVFQVLEGAPELVECVDDAESCPLQDGCPTRATWVEMNRAITRILEGTTLQNLVDRKRQKGGTIAPMYHI